MKNERANRAMSANWRGPGARLFRYGWAAAGPVSIAACQFLLSLQLLRTLNPRSFGTFAFLMVASQFSSGVWSALFCAPLPVLIGEGEEVHRLGMLRCLFAMNFVCAALAFSIFTLLAQALDVLPLPALLFAAYAALSLLRWYARAFAYTTGSPLKATMSDLVFSVSLLVGIVLIAKSGSNSLDWVYGTMAISVALGLATFGAVYLFRQFCDVSPADLLRYGDVWRRHSSWSLAGVVSTEATGNAHAYIVTLLAGPSAFAPVAASALIIRPIAVVTNALTDFERPQIARHIGSGHIETVRHTMVLFRLVLIAFWLACVVGGIALLRFSPHVIFPARYSIAYLALGAGLWMLVAGVRLVKTPESVLLQSAGAFKWLAYASIISSGISVVAVVVILWIGGPMWSIVGVLMGEAVFAVTVRRRARWWLAKQVSETREAPSFGLASGSRAAATQPLSRGV